MTKKITNKPKWFIEVTDTYGGESNYCWVYHFVTEARTEMGAMRKLANEFGYNWRNKGATRWDAKDAAICAFVDYYDEDSHSSYKIKNI